MKDLLKKGDFYLFDFEVVQFQSVLLEPEDNYYTIKHWGGRITHVSQCASLLIPLKEMLSNEQYYRLVYLWKINKQLWNKKPTPIFMNGFGDFVFMENYSNPIVLNNKTINQIS